MKTTAIICEYNPLHKGHEYAISTAKKSADAVVAVMSADFVQRGEAAVMPAVYRARAALAAGCDLVLELPVPYSCGSSEYFARAGVYIADAVGVCDTLFFGSESGCIDELVQAAERLSGAEYRTFTAEVMEKDCTLGLMQARYTVAKKLYGDSFAELIAKSNNILALEYIKAARDLNSRLSLETTERMGSGYNDTEQKADEYVSATFLRERIFAGDDISLYVPEKCIPIYDEAKKGGFFGAKLERAESAVLSFFRLNDPEKLSDFAEASGGLAHRLCRAANDASSLPEFFELAATKKYTNARIRRAVLACMLGVGEDELKSPPAYTRVLAANENGFALLKRMKKESGIPVITTVSDLDGLGKKNERAQVPARRADALYSLMLPTPIPSGELFKRSVFTCKK